MKVWEFRVGLHEAHESRSELFENEAEATEYFTDSAFRMGFSRSQVGRYLRKSHPRGILQKEGGGEWISLDWVSVR